MRLISRHGILAVKTALLALLAALAAAGQPDCAAAETNPPGAAVLDLDRAIANGLFRQVGVVVYDLRKPQPGWTQFANVKVIESALGRTVVNVAGAPGPANLVVVRNLPRSVKPGEQITFFAKPVDSANTPASGQKTPRNYDAGVPCGRADIPEALLASAVSSAPAPSKQ